MLRLLSCCCAAAVAVLALAQHGRRRQGSRRRRRRPRLLPAPDLVSPESNSPTVNLTAPAQPASIAETAAGSLDESLAPSHAALQASSVASAAVASAATRGVAARLDHVAPVVYAAPPFVEQGDECTFCLEPLLTVREPVKTSHNANLGSLGSDASAEATPRDMVTMLPAIRLPRLRVTFCGHVLHASCLERWVFHCADAYLDCANYSLSDDGRIDGTAPPPTCPNCAADLRVISDAELRHTLLITIARSLSLSDLAAANDMLSSGLVRWPNRSLPLESGQIDRGDDERQRGRSSQGQTLAAAVDSHPRTESLTRPHSTMLAQMSAQLQGSPPSLANLVSRSFNRQFPNPPGQSSGLSNVSHVASSSTSHLPGPGTLPPSSVSNTSRPELSSRARSIELAFASSHTKTPS